MSSHFFHQIRPSWALHDIERGSLLGEAGETLLFNSEEEARAKMEDEGLTDNPDIRAVKVIVKFEVTT